jgi:uncharacterized membrane protein
MGRHAHSRREVDVAAGGIQLERRVRSWIWLIPLAGLLASLVLAVITLEIDRATGYDLIPRGLTGSPSAEQQLLSTAATAIFSLSATVITLVLVLVQLAMGQFSPRIVRSLLQDRRNQAAFALFIGTFVYTMAVLRGVDDQHNTLPGFSVLCAYLLILCSVAVLVLFIDRAAGALRVSGLIDLVGDSTRAQLRQLSPLGTARVEDSDRTVIRSPEAGNVDFLDEARLVEIARRADCRLELLPVMGDSVNTDAPLFRIADGSLDERQRAEVLECIVIEPERSHDEDPAYGIRKLVDISLRSIASSPFDDPTTTVQALHRVHDCMRMLATRELPSGHHHDSEGRLRLVVPVLDWEGYVRLAFHEIRLAGAGSPQVARALHAALEDIRGVAPEERRPPLERELVLLDRAVERAYEDDADRDVARVADTLGIGSGSDVVRPDGAESHTPSAEASVSPGGR